LVFVCLLIGLGLQACPAEIVTLEPVEYTTEAGGEFVRHVEAVTEPSVGDSHELVGVDAGRAVWENRSIVPIEGLDLDAGIPEGYNWGEPGAGYMQQVLTFSPAKGAAHGHADFPSKLQGPPKGLGDAKGSLDVVSLGCGGSIVLEFRSPLIGNGPGDDFVIFENAFYPGGGKETFAEPAQVSVSQDGRTWHSFPCQPDKDPWPHPACAGVRPVYTSPSNPIPPHDRKASGGDGYDLSDVGLPWVRFVKIEDKSHLSPDASIWCGAYNAGFDLDAVAVIWGFRR
jgi:hypothetical protein